MNMDSDCMEHRWGTRVDLDIPAEIVSAEGHFADASIRNASLSGAFVDTTAKLPLLSRVSVNAGSRAGEWLDACVVRVEERGIALEWLDPGSPLVPALIALRRDNCGRVLQTSTPRLFTVLAADRSPTGDDHDDSQWTHFGNPRQESAWHIGGGHLGQQDR